LHSLEQENSCFKLSLNPKTHWAPLDMWAYHDLKLGYQKALEPTITPTKESIFELIDELPCGQLMRQRKSLENRNSLLVNYIQNIAQTSTFNDGPN